MFFIPTLLFSSQSAESMPFSNSQQHKDNQKKIPRRILSAESKITPIEKIRGSTLATFYRNNLRGIYFFRILNFIFIVIYSNFVNLALRKNKTTLVKLNNFLYEASIKKRIIFNVEHVKISKVKVLNPELLLSASLESFNYDYPPVYWCVLNDVYVFGRTNLISVEGSFIANDLINFQEDITSEEMNGFHYLCPKTMQLASASSALSREELPVAASFIDAVASNYAHWLTEILPKIALFCSMEDYKDVPIIINDELHSSMMDSLDLIAGDGREIIILPKSAHVRVKDLYVISAVGYVPFGPRIKKNQLINRAIFSPSAQNFLRSSIFNHIDKRNNSSYSKKIFIKRKSNMRMIINADEIESYLIKNNFLIIDPEKLSFLEQVNTFANADCILGPVGAAIANTIFSTKGAKIGLIIGNHRDTPYTYWPSVINCSQSLDIFYILGNQDRIYSEIDGVHANYYVPLGAIQDFINKI